VRFSNFYINNGLIVVVSIFILYTSHLTSSYYNFSYSCFLVVLYRKAQNLSTTLTFFSLSQTIMMKSSILAAALTLFSLVNASPISVDGPTSNGTVISESASNPIGNLYPNNVTGTLNGTIIVVPIPYTLARSLIPAKFNILQKAYQELLPELPKDQYPVSVLILPRYQFQEGG
jgi:hypothetical protein